jgi:hypothetical protein
MIPRKLVLDPSSEWFCNECTAINEKAKSPKAVRVKKPAAAAATAEESTAVAAPLSSADVVSVRKDYFQSLPKESLVDLLMQASGLTPDLALWQLHPPPPPRLASTAQSPHPAPASGKEDAYPTPTDEPSDGAGDGDEDKGKDKEDEEGYEYEDQDEHKKLYPKPGNGVFLPPESEDLDMLLEGPECGTFSHRLGEGVVAVGVGVGVANGTG